MAWNQMEAQHRIEMCERERPLGDTTGCDFFDDADVIGADFLRSSPLIVAESDDLAAKVSALLDARDDMGKKELVTWLSGEAKQLAISSQGCRVIQKAIEAVRVSDRHIITRQLENHVVELYESPHGNYVLAKMIEVMPPPAIGFIIEQMHGGAAVAARHRYGCRIVERLVEHCSENQISALLDEITFDVEALSRHAYGNFVVQHLLEHGSIQRRSSIIHMLLPSLASLAVHRTASHVVQRAFDFSDGAGQRLLIQTLMAGEGQHSIEVIAASRYGCFVVEQLARADPSFEQIRSRLMESAQILRGSQFGARVAAAFKLDRGLIDDL